MLLSIVFGRSVSGQAVKQMGCRRLPPFYSHAHIRRTWQLSVKKGAKSEAHLSNVVVPYSDMLEQEEFLRTALPGKCDRKVWNMITAGKYTIQCL